MKDAMKQVQHELNDELKRAFPRKKISVKALRGKDEGIIEVEWTNGPSIERVHTVCEKYLSQVKDINEIRHMTHPAKELALSMLVENNRKVRLTVKGKRLNTDLDKETIAGLLGGQYVLNEPSSITDAIRQVFNQMDF